MLLEQGQGIHFFTGHLSRPPACSRSRCMMPYGAPCVCSASPVVLIYVRRAKKDARSEQIAAGSPKASREGAEVPRRATKTTVPEANSVLQCLEQGKLSSPEFQTPSLTPGHHMTLSLMFFQSLIHQQNDKKRAGSRRADKSAVTLNDAARCVFRVKKKTISEAVLEQKTCFSIKYLHFSDISYTGGKLVDRLCK